MNPSSNPPSPLLDGQGGDAARSSKHAQKFWRGVFVTLVFYAASSAFAFIFFLAALRSGLLQNWDILFYRGLAAITCAFIGLTALLAFALRGGPGGLTPRDALGGALTGCALVFAAFVLGPVTVDRSISVFLLSRFEQNPMTPEQARAAFIQTYVLDWRQIERRLSEQRASGNLEQDGETWRLTPQGRRFMETSREMSRLFDADPRFVNRSANNFNKSDGSRH